MIQPGAQELLAQLRRDGVVSEGATLHPLTGGVSSEIYRVDQPGRSIVVKCALPTLRVAEEWRADPSRNIFEQRFLTYVARFLPECVPAIIAHGANYFAMEFFGPGFVNWKARLLAGDARESDALSAGLILGRIHTASAGDPTVARDFDSTDNFFQLRVEPYLLAVGRRHVELGDICQREAERLCAARECLVHGDYSPKNILIEDHRMVILDCEVAWYGDPAFDVAFLLSHLLLKSAYHAPREIGLPRLIDGFLTGYNATRQQSTEQATALDYRTTHLVQLLLLRASMASPLWNTWTNHAAAMCENLCSPLCGNRDSRLRCRN